MATVNQKTNGDITISKLLSDGASKINLFADANNGVIGLETGSGIQLGVNNMNPQFSGTDTFLDCSIVSGVTQSNFFGSSLFIKTQPQIQGVPSTLDTQSTQISIVPGNFITGVYGVGIKTETPDCPLTVFSPNGFQQPGQYNNAIARFDWDMGGVVFPKVDSNNQSMMAPEDGMVLYNTTVRKLQVYSFGSWVNLH